MPPKKLRKETVLKSAGMEDIYVNMEETPSTIATNDNENIETKNKMLLAKYITQACKKEMKYGSRYSIIHIFNRASFYTGINRLYLSNMRSGIHCYTFKNFLSNVNGIAKFTCKETYEDIRRILVQYYVYNSNIPTIKTLIKSLEKDGFSYDKKLLMFILYKTGFVLTKLPNTSIKIIIEKPDAFSHRMRYLEKIRHYRRTNRNIVYIRDMKLELQKNECLFIMGVSPKLEWTNFIFCELHMKFFLRWLSEYLIPFLPPSSVVVLDHDTRCVIPTMCSPKQELVEWLQVRDIPHDAGMHRAELFSLVEKFKNNCELDMDQVYQYIKGHGHDVLRVVPGMRDLNYLEALWQGYTQKFKNNSSFQNLNMNLTNEMISNINSYSNEQMKKIEADLIISEEKYYKEDIAMEEIIDKLKTLAKYGDIPKSELDLMNSGDPSVSLDSDFIIL